MSAAPAAGVSGTVAMGGGATGGINEQTGVFQMALPLVSLPGRGSAGAELALSYDQNAAASGADRFSLGQGIGLGKAFVDPDDGGTLHTPGGGSFRIDARDTTGPGLKRYLLKDMSLREQPGTLAQRAGLEDTPRDYRWVLSYGDGRKSYFSGQGDLVAEQDAFGNQTAYVWQQLGGQHRLEKMTDTWGQAVTFDYSTENQVTVTSPERSDGKQPEIVLHLSEGRLEFVTYPHNQVTKLAYGYTPQGMPGRLLTRAEAPAGAVTRIGYTHPHGFPVTSSVKVTDADGRSLTPERTFTLDVQGENAGHDYTGHGQYATADDLFDSADPDYRYTTELSDGRSAVRSTYNSLHLLKERTASLKLGDEMQPLQTQELHYEGERNNGQTPPASSALPPNYARPTRATLTVHDPATGKQRTTTETARFDDHGREVERTDVTGATTVTEYDSAAVDDTSARENGEPAGFGLVLKQTTTGADGAQTITENTLSGDHRSLAATKQSVKNKAGEEPSARTVTTYKVNGHGEITGKTVTWAAGAKPEETEGPDQLTETYGSTADTTAHTRTDTVTSPAGVTSQVTDLVTGQVVKTTDAEGRT
ncbi:hypothetical protein, partial [Streptomyces sp. NPDC008121]|uniref:hypothetical protein n=1 Tax=Streptomyces sp. NPDC008121 TaxID=3364809 RepID=UPI0036E85360